MEWRAGTRGGGRSPEESGTGGIALSASAGVESGPAAGATLISPRASVGEGAAGAEPLVTALASSRPVLGRSGGGPESLKGSTLCGRYRLEAVLGRGGMGVVYRAADLQMPGVEVAIKLLLPEFRAQPELLNILRESVRKVRSLPHPNIASVYSLDSDGENDFVIMELLQGGQTLQALLDGEYARGLPIAMARTLIADLCSALAYAHDHSVIHSDIKPSNIFVTASGRAKLFDFDIARVLRGPVGYFDASQVGAITRAYCSIEMARGDRPDPRDDVYALACVIYEMLSGAHPFDGVTAWDARDKGLQVKPLSVLSRRENSALAQALSFEREDRLASVEALQSAFAVRGGERAGVLRLRLAPVVAAVVGVVVCAAVVWWLLRSASVSAQQEGVARAAAELDRAKSLAVRAGQLAVDEHDESFRQALALLGSVRESDPPERRLQQAQSASAAITAALAHSPRVARLGTPEGQLEQALELCQRLKIGSHHCSAKDLADEAPRAVSLQPFELDAGAVTNADFARFADATGRRTLAESAGLLYAPDPTRGWDIVLRGQSWRTVRGEAAGRGEDANSAPVVAMDLESARDYCKWKGKRLPTEDEWEYSARGVSGRVFPWGNQPDGAAGSTAGASLGHVAEWTETRIPGQRVLRGGSWLLPEPYFQRLALRRLAPPGAVLDAGFRCAASVGSWPH